MNSKFSCSFFYYFFILLLFTTTLLAQAAPAELINIEKLDDSLQIRIAYSTKINFTQKKIDGYSKNICFFHSPSRQLMFLINSSFIPFTTIFILCMCSSAFSLPPWFVSLCTRSVSQEYVPPRSHCPLSMCSTARCVSIVY